MSIIDSSLIRKNALFAIGNVSTTLTAVSPTNTATYVANKQDMEIAFAIFEDGRETTIDTKFYLTITATDHTEAQLPSKGFVLTDGTNNYKVMGTFKDAKNVTIRLDCQAQGQR
jgi:outer membrane protein assembly factor BamA